MQAEDRASVCPFLHPRLTRTVFLLPAGLASFAVPVQQPVQQHMPHMQPKLLKHINSLQTKEVSGGAQPSIMSLAFLSPCAGHVVALQTYHHSCLPLSSI